MPFVTVPAYIILEVPAGTDDVRVAVGEQLEAFMADPKAGSIVSIISGAAPYSPDNGMRYTWVGDVMVAEQKANRVKIHADFPLIVTAASREEAQQRIMLLAQNIWQQRYPAHTRLVLNSIAGPLINLVGPMAVAPTEQAQEA